MVKEPIPGRLYKYSIHFWNVDTESWASSSHPMLCIEVLGGTYDGTGLKCIFLIGEVAVKIKINCNGLNELKEPASV